MKNLKNFKSVLCLLLSFVMVFGVCGNVVFADTTDVDGIISGGIGSAESYIETQLNTAHAGEGVGYGYEWHIITLLRAGKTIESDILDEYYTSASAQVKNFGSNVKPTDAERVALAMTAMGKDITNIDGVNLAQLIYNNARLEDGSNEIAYALITFYASNTTIPSEASYSVDTMIEKLLTYQKESGGFYLSGDYADEDVDVTAYCIQALAPYTEKSEVATAIEKAVGYLKSNIGSNYGYANANSTAQVLLALSTVNVDVTDISKGFAGESGSIINACETYRNTDGDGYTYNNDVNPAATCQVMQSYDAFRKMKKENLSYWNFQTAGSTYDDKTTGGGTEGGGSEASAETIYVTIVSGGDIVSDKDGKYVAQAPVTVKDRNKDGKLTVDEALYATHEAYYNGGASAGYSSYTSSYGLSLAKLWGVGTENVTASAGYWLNNVSCMSLGDEVKSNDYLTAFNYYDTKNWGDAYSFFEDSVKSAKNNVVFTLKLKCVGYDGWNPVTLPCGDAKVKVIDSNGVVSDGDKTNENGEISLTLATGTYYAIAYKDDRSIVPSACKINVTRSSGTGGSISGGSGSGNVSLSCTVKFNSNGGSDVAKQTVGKNTTVSEPNVPTKDGYVFDGWYSDEKFSEKYDFSSKVTESMTLYAKWTIESEVDDNIDMDDVDGDTETEVNFGDVDQADWYYDAVKYVVENKLMNGVSDDDFAPNDDMTRAMLVTVLYRLSGSDAVTTTSEFTDVDNDIWYSDAVAWASENGIVAGVGDNKFAPEQSVTREEVGVILYRYAALMGYSVEIRADLSAYSDSDAISDWASEALEWANGSRLINGTDNNCLAPNDTATRAEIAAVLMRFCLIEK